MFAAPPAVEAEVFARIPDEFRSHSRESEWSRIQFHGAQPGVFLEGPVFDDAGFLWVTDIPWGRLFKIAPDGAVELGCEYDGLPNGMKFLDDGRALIADHHHGLMLFDPASGSVEPYVTRHLLEPFKGCNDLTVARNGDIYFTDQGQTGWHDPSGRLFRIRAGTDRLECLLDNIPSPNGLVLNKAETQVLLAVTRANAVWRVPLVMDGYVSKVGTFIQMSGGSGPDGLTIDEDDNLVVCHVGFGAVWLFSARGEPMLRINSPLTTYTTNAAYGGPEGKTLFFTDSLSSTVLRAELPVRGREVYPARVKA